MSANFNILNEICEILETCDGRDKVLRSLCYIAKLAAASSPDELNSKRFKRFSGQMSNARNIIQLLDDLPMLKDTLDYGLGHEEPDKFLAAMGFSRNIIDHIGYTIEKVTWLSEEKLISLNNKTFWDVANTVIKIFSMFLILIRCIAYKKLEWITILRLVLDLSHAINSLPPGFLWSTKLNALKIGIIGTLSSLLAVTQLFVKRVISVKYKNKNDLL